MRYRFIDRRDAGLQLAEALRRFAGDSAALILALPRGGVPVAFEAATRLRLPMDVFIVRKIGVPQHEELALGAVAGDGTTVLNDQIVRSLGLSEAQVESLANVEREELRRRDRLYREGRPFPPLEGRTVILVDDGLATGASMRAAVQAVRAMRPSRVVVAVPVGAPETVRDLGHEADEVICLISPPEFRSVGSWYDDFMQTSDDQVRDLLSRAEATHSAS